MQTRVAKFGGSSLADAGQFFKVAEIIRGDVSRRYVVASAPGKRYSDDIKVTDMLYDCYDKAAQGGDFESVLRNIKQRYQDIIQGLGIAFPIDGEMDIISAHLAGEPKRDYMASRGEYLNSKILAAYLGYDFLDAADYIKFTESGEYDDRTTDRLLSAALKRTERAVVPGFYGALPDGTIHTFSRGGSDVTGAIVAKAAAADLYENWTDVSGMLIADPRIVDDPEVIDYISYRELRELSYMGASVLHEDAVFPAKNAGIPINIRNTNRPQDNGTMIVHEVPDFAKDKVITGIAGHKGFSSILIEKTMMNSEVGFGEKVLKIIADHGISFEHLPSGIDTMSIIVNSQQLESVKKQVLDEIQRSVSPDSVNIEDGLALIAVVGHGMVYTKGTAARIFSAIANANINIRMIDQGSSELNIIVGVDIEDYENAIRAIYKGFKDLL